MPGRKKGFSKSAKSLPRQKKSRSRSRSRSPGSGKKGRKTKSASPKPGKEKKAVADPMSKEAMYNAYYICHGAVDFLEKRGFGWPNAAAKKGKKGKGKGKKKK